MIGCHDGHVTLQTIIVAVKLDILSFLGGLCRQCMKIGSFVLFRGVYARANNPVLLFYLFILF